MTELAIEVRQDRGPAVRRRVLNATKLRAVPIPELTITADQLVAPVPTLPTPNPVALALKHGADRLLALFGLIVLAPVLMLVAVAIRVDSPGPVFFRQERVGRDGRLFRIWKLRTMRDGADAELHRLLQQHGRHDAPLFKVPDDPRITRLGRWLRKYSVDEIPQLWNVVRGEMSLVGPRPQRPAEVALYTPRDRLRLRMKPGLTGLWQINGRSDLEWDLAIKFDLKYVRSWSLRHDAAILARTVGVVLRGSGAE